MADAARSRGIPELWAGNYGALTPEVQSKFDRIFTGYSERDVAAYFDRDVKTIVHPPLIEYLDTPFRVKLNIYGILFTTRGCGVGCKFCQTPCFAPKPSPIPIESIERVVAYYKRNGINIVLIEDENFGAIRRHADRVVELLDDYDMTWGCMARADYLSGKIDEWVQSRTRVAKKDGTARQLTAGFAGAAIGIENIHQERLDDIKKHEGTEDILGAVRLLRKHGMGVIGYYMIGFEDDTVASIKADMKKLAALKLDITQICVMTPLPQTLLWNEIHDRWGIFDHDYHHFDGKHLVWNHPHIKPDEMEGVLDWSLKTVYPWNAPIRTSARVWGSAYRYAGFSGIKEVASYIKKANKFDFRPNEPRLLV